MHWNVPKLMEYRLNVFRRKILQTEKNFTKLLLRELQKNKVDLVVLAGYLVAIPPVIVEAYPNRIINIHPSLIPSFCGTGYYGLESS